jgi:hypothetical protein
VSSSYFERLPEFADKLRTTYNVDQDTLREILFQNALNEGDLDDELEQLYPDAEFDEARQYASVADFPNYIPFEGYDIDPDNETLNAYRLAAENPKAREFVEQNNDLNTLLPGGTVESARTAYLQAVNRGDLTPQQREALRYAGESRFLSDANYRSDAGEALNNLLQAYGDRYNVDYSQNLENVADILEQADEVIRPVEVGLGARETMLRYADRDTVAQDPLSNRIDQNTVQLGLPLRGRDPGIAERYAAIRNNPPQTIEELNAQAAEIRALRQATGREGPINTFPIEGSALLPQVADLLAPESSPRRREFLLEQAERQARDPNRNTLYQLQRNLTEQEEPSVRSSVEDARRMARTVNMSPAEIDPLIPTVTTPESLQFGLPGLENQLLETREIARQEAVKEQAQKLNKFVEQYPEIGPYLQGSLSDTTPKIERNIEKLSPYLDLEQEISKPEARQNIYNLAMKELGVQPSYLSQIEQDYTSGDSSKQKEAINRLNQLGYGEQLRAGSASAVSRRTPVVGGGGYAKGRELQDALSFIRQRANEFENIDNTPVVSSMSSTSGPLAIKNPSLKTAPSMARFSYDPDTGVASPDPTGDYGIRINTNPAPTRFRLGTSLPVSNEVSRNVLNYLKDNPVTRMSSVSFETQTPTEDFDYSAKEIPAPVFEQMNKFITENVLRNMRPGMLLENSPIGTADLARLREEQGKSPSESSILRRQEEFKGQQPNRRGAAYRSVGFGPLMDTGNQLLYMNSEGNIVPLQVGRPAASLAGDVAIVDPRSGDPRPLRAEVTQSREPLTSKAYYSGDPISMAAQGAREYARAIRRTPAALLPGAADLIPSPEAIQTGYREGLGPMAQQMGREFVQSLPTAAAASSVLALPAVAPLAPGIGAGMVGTAGARALNEVVRQETGEGIVPKLRQALGTAPRTGVASPARTGPQPLTAQIRPLTQAQRTEQQRQQNRSEAQRRIDLARERFNPRRGEFGLSELLFGR